MEIDPLLIESAKRVLESQQIADSDKNKLAKIIRLASMGRPSSHKRRNYICSRWKY